MPQPTPAEVDELIRTLTERAGEIMPFSEVESAAFLDMHNAQIEKHRSKVH